MVSCSPAAATAAAVLLLCHAHGRHLLEVLHRHAKAGDVDVRVAAVTADAVAAPLAVAVVVHRRDVLPVLLLEVVVAKLLHAAAAATAAPSRWCTLLLARVVLMVVVLLQWGFLVG